MKEVLVEGHSSTCVKEVLVEGHSRRGRPPGKWRDRVKKYMCERGATSGRGLDQTRRKYLTQKGGGFSAMHTPLENVA